MAPLTSITAVTAEPRHSKSSLLVTTAVGSADFHMDPVTAEQAQTLLTRLISEANAQPEVASSVTPRGSGAGIDDLINLRWKFDAAVVDPADFDEEPRRLLGC